MSMDSYASPPRSRRSDDSLDAYSHSSHSLIRKNAYGDISSFLEKSVHRVDAHLKKSQFYPWADLCNTCQSMFDYGHAQGSHAIFNSASWSKHHSSQVALDKAVARGCVICHKITKSLSELGIETGRKTSSGFVDPNDLWWIIHGEHYVHHLLISYGERRQELVGYILMNGELQESWVGSGLNRERLGGNLASSTAQTEVGSWMTQSGRRQKWDLCRSWLYKCREEHSECRHHKGRNLFRPSRLLSVQRTGKGTISARLVCTSASDKAVEYLTLSHCWGTTQFFKLFRRNIGQLQRRLEVQILPRVFQDAFITTLELGFSYIWIDSLCIVQDSHEDWLRESSQMGDIYKNCSCNIAATGFADGSDGLFMQKGLDNIAYHTIHTTRAEPGSDVKEGTVELCDASLFKSQITESPLNKRAWVLQESLLAPCVLHFGEEQLLWECSKTCGCELFPRGFPAGLIRDYLRFLLKSTLTETPNVVQLQNGEITLKVPAHDQQRHYDLWHQLAQMYSSKQLSHAGDKLLAFAGLAKRARYRIQDRYLAGLWEQNFVEDLLWYTKDTSDRNKSLQKYKAPSWSWASVDAAILYALLSLHGYRVCAALRRAKLTYSTSDETGLVTSGRAQMEGRLLPVKPLKRSAETALEDRFVVNGEKLTDLRVYFDYTLHKKPSNGERQLPELQSHGTSSDTPARMRAIMQLRLLRIWPMFLLPLVSESAYGTAGLVLMPTGYERGQYVRLGMFMTPRSSSQALILRPAKKPLHPELYEKDLGDGRYVFSIV